MGKKWLFDEKWVISREWKNFPTKTPIVKNFTYARGSMMSGRKYFAYAHITMTSKSKKLYLCAHRDDIGKTSGLNKKKFWVPVAILTQWEVRESNFSSLFHTKSLLLSKWRFLWEKHRFDSREEDSGVIEIPFSNLWFIAIMSNQYLGKSERFVYVG